MRIVCAVRGSIGIVGSGFSVDPTALSNAGRQVADLIADVVKQPMAEIARDEATIGHDGLAGAMTTFCGRWQAGTGHLTEDGRRLSDKLTNSAEAYTRNDQNAANRLTGVRQGGPADV
jgi:hypothetical protein